MKTCLTIAGSDSSGGAGIQADIKTMTVNGVYAMSAITALTAQNTTGVFAVSEVSADFLAQELDAIFTDIYPDAVKIGMVSSITLIKTITKKLKQYKAKNIVVDPVMVATSGARLMEIDATKTLTEELFPLATLITPNIPEAEILSNKKIKSKEDMELVSEELYKTYKVAVLLKGGHSLSTSNDVLYSENGLVWLYGNKIDNPNTHGTGCTLSSAIAANLAKGLSLKDAISNAKVYLEGALKANLDLGKGSGPLDHAWKIHKL